MRLLRALPLLPLLLLAGLGALSAGESAGPGTGNGPSGSPAVRLSRRYSEATLASDYSRTMDHVLRKNFVEWLLARRERESADPAEPPRGQSRDLGAPGAAGTRERERERGERPSFPEGSEGLREFWEQEFLTWLRLAELCGARTT